MKRNDAVSDQWYSRFYPSDGQRYVQNRHANRTDIITRMLIRNLTELAANRFEWEGLPDEIDKRFLEMQLFHNSLAVFFKDTDEVAGVEGKGTDKYMALRGGSASGYPDMYDNPTRFFVTGNQMIQRTIDADKCVPIWANYTRTPDIDIVLIYAERIAELDRTIEINSDNARRSKVIVANETTRLSAANFNKQISEGQPFIEIKGPNMMDNAVVALDLGIDANTLVTLSVLRARHWNDCMTLLGINNSNQDKKERLVADEVSANDAQIDAMKNVSLNARQEACERINDMFGLHVSVDFKKQETEEVEESDDKEKPDA